jgi:hypothetical protein
MPASANALSGDSGEIVLDDVPVSSSNENDVCVSQNSSLRFKVLFFLPSSCWTREGFSPHHSYDL